MSDKTTIEWTDATWNPVTGCTKVSPGCAHCYAEAITLRFRRGGPYLPGLATIRLHEDRLGQPRKWTEPRRVFVNSMSDLFHEHVPFEFVDRVFQVMADCPHHCFQILTKRPERMLEYSQRLGVSRTWPNHVWAGTSVENQYWADRRVPILREVPAPVRFLSCEPLLKPLSLDLSGIDWVIVGGESGPKARPMRGEWVADIRHQCERAGVPFFFKQWGGRTCKAGGRILDGKLWNAMPFARPSGATVAQDSFLLASCVREGDEVAAT
ncbi:MAG: phage Gp37/Gp68 family protein [Chloroflexi bacterium]|nr:phage Gp37/Gp68 family protein [Chloroflexota bacterium]